MKKLFQSSAFNVLWPRMSPWKWREENVCGHDRWNYESEWWLVGTWQPWSTLRHRSSHYILPAEVSAMSSWMIFLFLQYLVSCVTHDEGVSERSEVSAMSSWMIFLFLFRGVRYSWWGCQWEEEDWWWWCCGKCPFSQPVSWPSAIYFSTSSASNYQ